MYNEIARDDDPAGWTCLGYRPFVSTSDCRHWIADVSAGNDPLFSPIVDTANDGPLGMARYLRIAPANGVVEVGYPHCTHPLRRTPAATEAVMMRRAFELRYCRYERKYGACMPVKAR